MAAPLSMPSEPAVVLTMWRVISSLRLVRRLLGIREEERALASAARDADTSLTQAELEILK